MFEFLTTSKDWPADAPPYHSVAGWEYEKKAAYERMKALIKLKSVKDGKQANSH